MLNTSLSLKNRTLLLLHATPGPVAEAALRGWVEAKNPTQYRRDILVKAHADKLVEFDPTARTVTLSPNGRDYVEGNLAAWVLR